MVYHPRKVQAKINNVPNQGNNLFLAIATMTNEQATNVTCCCLAWLLLLILFFQRLVKLQSNSRNRTSNGPSMDGNEALGGGGRVDPLAHVPKSVFEPRRFSIPAPPLGHAATRSASSSDVERRDAIDGDGDGGGTRPETRRGGLGWEDGRMGLEKDWGPRVRWMDGPGWIPHPSPGRIHGCHPPTIVVSFVF